jgi:hypothetical protein
MPFGNMSSRHRARRRLFVPGGFALRRGNVICAAATGGFMTVAGRKTPSGSARLHPDFTGRATIDREADFSCIGKFWAIFPLSSFPHSFRW